MQADQLRSLGREVVSAMVPEVEVGDPLSVLSEDDRGRLAQAAGVPDFEKLLELIGMGQRSGKPGRVANLIRARSGIPLVIEKEANTRQTPLSDQQVLEQIKLPNRDAAPVCRVAGCCSGAIHMGDSVLARPSEHYHGVMQLHRTDCDNVTNLEEGLLCDW